MNRRERDQRMEADPGNPDERVRVAGRAGLTYHLDFECYHLARTAYTQDVTRAKAQERGFAPCQRCVLEWETRQSQQLDPMTRLRQAGLVDEEADGD